MNNKNDIFSSKKIELIKLVVVILSTIPLFGGPLILKGCLPVEPGTTPRISLTKKDSAAMVQLLRANSLPTGRTWDYVGLLNGFVNSIKMEKLGLKKFVFDKSIGDLDSLETIYLMINQIEVIEIPEEISINRKLKIGLNQNRIGAIPKDIGKIKNIEILDLYQNEINAVPADINHYGIQHIDIRQNRLCSVPDSIDKWLRTMDPNWSTTQRCVP